MTCDPRHVYFLQTYTRSIITRTRENRYHRGKYLEPIREVTTAVRLEYKRTTTNVPTSTELDDSATSRRAGKRIFKKDESGRWPRGAGRRWTWEEREHQKILPSRRGLRAATCSQYRGADLPHSATDAECTFSITYKQLVSRVEDPGTFRRH